MKNSRLVLTALLTLGPLVLPASIQAAPPTKGKPAGDPPEAVRDDAVRLQIFLDEHNFGPGKIDGNFGGFTKLFWNLYQKAQGVATPREDFDARAQPIASISPVYANYTVTAADLGSIGQVPSEVSEQAQEKSLPYTSMAELIGERYHTDVRFLRALNAPMNLDALKEGDQVKVPNVTPIFDLNAVLAARQAAIDAKKKADEEKMKAEEAKKAGGKTSPDVANGMYSTAPSPSLEPSPALAPSPAPPAIDVAKRYVHVSVKQSYLELREGDKLLACFPVTPGSTAIPTPQGDWKIESKTLMPVFRYDKEMLNHGKRSDDFQHLPPGPNNPVGIAWIALNRKGIGLHGTNEPDTIGRSASHGCIRLANWDAFKLYGMVDKGMRVTIE